MESVYVAQFDLSSPHQQVLSFKKGERFIPLPEKSSNKSWAMGVSLSGNYGYLPYSYIKEEMVPRAELASFIEIALESIERNSSGSYTKGMRQVIQQLTTWLTLLLSPMHSPIDAKEAVSANDETIGKPVAVITNTNAYSAHHACNSTNSDVAHPKGQSQSANADPHCSYSKHDVNASAESVNSKVTVPDLNNSEGCSVDSIPPKHDTTNDCRSESHMKLELADVGTQFPDTLSDNSGEKSNCPVKDAGATQSQAECPKCSKVDVPMYLVPSLIENIRRETQLSHQNSKVAVAVVVDTLSEALPSLNMLWKQMKSNLQISEVIQEETEDVVYREDRRKLLNIFKQLWCCKNDEQQRSWPVREDEGLIAALLEDLNTLLMDADPKISKEAIQHDDYELVNLLVTYYQMEARRVLRVKMLHVFVTICKLDVAVVSQLLQSVLPMELARDMQCTLEDTEKLQFSAFVLTIIFSTGQKPPNAIYEFIDKKFIDFIFENVESSMRDGDEEISDHLLNILLAFNLHLPNVQHNPVFNALKEREDVRMLTVKLVFYVNREVDPVNVLDIEGENPNSVLKFLVDFFAFPQLAQMFYLNDIRVLLDIIVRQLTDYLPGEQKRLWYLRLVTNLLQNSNYHEHFHQQSGLQKCFNTILAQEDPCVQEVDIVQDILTNFPDWFSVQ